MSHLTDLLNLLIFLIVFISAKQLWHIFINIIVDLVGFTISTLIMFSSSSRIGSRHYYGSGGFCGESNGSNFGGGFSVGGGSFGGGGASGRR
ncbi:MAG: hypothetical protein ABFS32_01260 [Bacteroidota bacterium]